MKSRVPLSAFALLATLEDLERGHAPEPPPRTACPMCGSTAKTPTGECAHCGVFKCPKCGNYKLGDASRPGECRGNLTCTRIP